MQHKAPERPLLLCWCNVACWVQLVSEHFKRAVFRTPQQAADGHSPAAAKSKPPSSPLLDKPLQHCGTLPRVSQYDLVFPSVAPTIILPPPNYHSDLTRTDGWGVFACSLFL